MDSVGAILLVLAVITALGYSITAHSLAVISRKTGQSSTMELLAWIPLLQIIPTLAVGGGSVGHFLLGAVAVLGANVALGLAAQFLGGGLGGVLFGIGVIATTLLSTVYFARICWNTAGARNLPRWFGLLVFAPGISFFVYPVMAFHDGWVWPPKLAPGLVLLFMGLGLAVPYPLLKHQLEQQSQAQIELSQSAQLDGASPEVDSREALRALYELKNQFEELEALILNPSIDSAEPSKRPMEALGALRAELLARRSELDPTTYEELATHLIRIEARLEDPNSSSATASARIWAPDRTNGPPKAHSGGAPPAAPASSNAGAPLRPFPVNASDDCPRDTELKTRTSDRGDEEWCQQLPRNGGLREGWYVRYFESGRPEQVGQYRNGLRVGVWTRFYDSGAVRAQAEFEKGLQHGWLLSFDESGRRQKAVRFESGAASP